MRSSFCLMSAALATASRTAEFPAIAALRVDNAMQRIAHDRTNRLGRSVSARHTAPMRNHPRKRDKAGPPRLRKENCGYEAIRR